MKYVFYYDTDLGKIGIVEANNHIISVFFGSKKVEAEEKETSLIKKANQQIHEYLAGSRKKFEIPILIKGTTFQKKVYEALLRIPYGETRTYQQIAEEVGSAKACRAVGLTNGKNPLWILVPCHRVIGKDGDLTGYAGGLTRKRKLLQLEKRNVKEES